MTWWPLSPLPCIPIETPSAEETQPRCESGGPQAALPEAARALELSWEPRTSPAAPIPLTGSRAPLLRSPMRTGWLSPPQHLHPSQLAVIGGESKPNSYKMNSRV